VSCKISPVVLDVNLSDRDVTPVAELLIEGGVPVIFYSGLDLPAALRERYPSAPAYKKPTPSLRLLNELATLISGSRRALAGQLLQMLSASSTRVYSNLLVLVRNKHPPAPAHDGKGLGEVINESSDGRQHAPGRREDQVDDALWRAPLGQNVDKRAAAHVLHATVLGQECHAESGKRGGAQHPEVFATQTGCVNVATFFACRAHKVPSIAIHMLAHRDRRQ
jgi:hypothetical protein